MQEEVTSRTVNLAISTTKLTARTIMKWLRMFLNHRAKSKAKKAAAKDEVPHGKQTVQNLIGQNQGSPRFIRGHRPEGVQYSKTEKIGH